MSAYRCVRHATAVDFLNRAENWLLRNEAEHNLVLGIAAQLCKSPLPSAYLTTVEHDNDIAGCAFRTPPYKLSVTRMPVGAAEALAEDVVQMFDDISAVLGPESVAGIVAQKIAEGQRKTAAPGMRQRIYELRRVVPPPRLPPGRLRLAQPADGPVLKQWLEAFALETDHGPGDIRNYTQAHIANKTIFVWDDDGPRTTALWSGATPHGMRIGFVYTPPEERGRGYASACVAGASQRALDSGCRFCCLYTDLSNPTSNQIYQRLGYRPIADVVDYNIS